MQVHDLLDRDGHHHDAPGYSNPRIAPGDRILRVDDMQCENVSVETLHRMLSGVVHTPVKIALARISDGTSYSVTVLRHAGQVLDAPVTALAESRLLDSHEGGYVGIKVTGAPPHAVVAVNSLVGHCTCRAAWACVQVCMHPHDSAM